MEEKIEGLLVQSRDIVVPGDLLTASLDFLPGEGTYRAADGIRASLLGLMEPKGRILQIIPLGGVYIPKAGDTIIGVISDVRFSNWGVDIGGPYGAALPLAEASEEFIDNKRNSMNYYFDFGEAIFCGVIMVDDQMNVNLTMCDPMFKKLKEGRIIEVAPSKVPRIIGKNASMVSTIKDATGCNIIVGQNGRVWIKGADKAGENLAIRAIKTIEQEAHKSGLTERVKELLEVGKSPHGMAGGKN